MVKHPLSVSLLTQGVATLWGLKVWEHIKNMKYFHLNLEIIWNLWELRNISSDMWKMEDCGSHQRGSGFKPKQVHLCEVCMFINGKCTYLNHSLPRSHHCSIPAQYFLSLDSSRADFHDSQLKICIFVLFCLFFDLGAALSSCFFWNISPISCGWTTKHSILKNSVSLCSWTQISAVCK